MLKYSKSDLHEGNISLERLSELVSKKIAKIDESVIKHDDLWRTHTKLQDLVEKIYLYVKKEIVREKEEVDAQNLEDDEKLMLLNSAVQLHNEFVVLLDNIIAFQQEQQTREMIQDADFRIQKEKEEKATKERFQAEAIALVERAEAMRVQAAQQAYNDALIKARDSNDRLISLNNQFMELQRQREENKVAAQSKFKENMNQIYQDNPEIYKDVPQDQLDKLSDKLFDHHDDHNQMIELAKQKRMAEYHSQAKDVPGTFASGWQTSTHYAKLQDDIRRIEDSRHKGVVKHHKDHGIKITHDQAKQLSAKQNNKDMKAFSAQDAKDKKKSAEIAKVIKEEIKEDKEKTQVLKEKAQSADLTIEELEDVADIINGLEANTAVSLDLLNGFDDIGQDEKFDLDNALIATGGFNLDDDLDLAADIDVDDDLQMEEQQQKEEQQAEAPKKPRI